MAELTKQALRVENNTEFPNNNNGQITPSRLRTFNEDMIDSTVNQAQYTTDSGSWNQQINALETATSSFVTSAITASSLITASFAAGTLTFTKGDATTFGVVIPDVSGSTINTGSFATTGSNTFNGNQIINGLTTINVGAAGTETQKDFIVVTGSVINTIPYTNVTFGLQDYASFGDSFKDAFVFDYYDSLSFTYGASLFHNGLRTGTELIVSGSGNSVGGKGYGINQLRTLGTGSFLNQYASVINIGSYAPSTTDLILIGHNALPYLQLSSLSNQITGSTTISGSNGLRVIGNTTITGSLTISSSASTDLLVQGRQIITGPTTGDTPQLQISGSDAINTIGRGTLVISASAGLGFAPQISLTSGSASGTVGAHQIISSDTLVSGSIKRIAISSNPSRLNASGLTATQPSLLGVNNSALPYQVFELQSQNNYTNGTISFKVPVEVTGSTAGVRTQITSGSVRVASGSTGVSFMNAGNLICSNFDGTQFQQIALENNEGTLQLSIDGTGSYIGDYDPNLGDYSKAIKFQPYSNYGVGQVQVLRPLQVTGSLSVSGSSTFNGNQTITGSVTISGSAANDLTIEGRQLITGPNSGQTPRLFISSSDSTNEIGRGNISMTGISTFEPFMNISSSLYRTRVTPREYQILKAGFDYPTFFAGYIGNSSSVLLNFTDNLSATASYNLGVFDNNFTQDVELYLETTTTNGVQFKDIDSSTGAYITFLKIAPNGGSNPPLEFKRGMQVTGSLSIQSGSAFFANGNRQFNVGTFTSLVSQSGSANVSQSMNFETTDISSGVSIVSNSQITLANSGTYNIQFSAQVLADSGADDVYIWLKKNGTNVAASAGHAVLSNNSEQIISWNYVVDAVANDYYELAWQSTQGDAILLAEAASGNIPSIPSVILTVTQVR